MTEYHESECISKIQKFNSELFHWSIVLRVNMTNTLFFYKPYGSLGIPVRIVLFFGWTATSQRLIEKKVMLYYPLSLKL